MANKINLLIDAYRRLNKHSENIVLATIIETMGSTYQKAGTCMIIEQNGELSGLLGGGCFERDLVEQAQWVFETGNAKTILYDMRSSSDVIWGLGLGCNGAVRVLLQLLSPEDNYSPLSSIAESVDASMTGILVTVYDSAHPDIPVGSSTFLTGLEGENPKIPLPPAPFLFMATARQVLLQGKPRVESHAIDGYSVKIFYNPIQPPLQLLVIGAGVDAVPVAYCAKSLGWRVTVVDHRLDYVKPGRFQNVDRLLHLLPEELDKTMDLSQFNATVLMTHNIEADLRFLNATANSGIPYIGLLGPAQRKDRLLQSLSDKGASITNRVYGPVGLDIGAETPEEIAVSIMAGIHAAIGGRDGRHLSTGDRSDLNGQFHESLYR